ncbi:transposase [Candidatus Latescibacterota bacterium]
MGNFLRRLVLPTKIKHWPLRSLLVKFIKTGAKIVRYSRYVTFQMAEVTIDKRIFTKILSRMNDYDALPVNLALLDKKTGDSCLSVVSFGAIHHMYPYSTLSQEISCIIFSNIII